MYVGAQFSGNHGGCNIATQPMHESAVQQRNVLRCKSIYCTQWWISFTQRPPSSGHYEVITHRGPARQHIFRLRIDNRTRTLSQIAASLLPVDPCCFGGQATRTNNQVRVWFGVRSITELRKLMTKERALPMAF